LNGSHEQNALGRERRRLFISYLENDPAGRCLSQSDWSSEDWEEASRLADFCRLLYECFPRCAGHNPYRQTPQSSSLSREIDDRLRLLLQSARASGDDERLKLFTRMKEWAEIYNFNSRSKYKLAIQAEMERPPDKDRLQSWDEKRNALKELLSLVDICYNISNGRNSSSTVELSDVDPVLQPLVGSDGEIRFHKDDDRLFSLRGRRIENGESAELVDSNLMEAAIIAHSIAWSSKNLTLEQLAALAKPGTRLQLRNRCRERPRLRLLVQINVREDPERQRRGYRRQRPRQVHGGMAFPLTLLQRLRPCRPIFTVVLRLLNKFAESLPRECGSGALRVFRRHAILNSNGIVLEPACRGGKPDVSSTSFMPGLP
jgi:hypothetical protein